MDYFYIRFYGFVGIVCGVIINYNNFIRLIGLGENVFYSLINIAIVIVYGYNYIYLWSGSSG